MVPIGVVRQREDQQDHVVRAASSRHADDEMTSSNRCLIPASRSWYATTKDSEPNSFVQTAVAPRPAVDVDANDETTTDEKAFQIYFPGKACTA